MKNFCSSSVRKATDKRPNFFGQNSVCVLPHTAQQEYPKRASICELGREAAGSRRTAYTGELRWAGKPGRVIAKPSANLGSELALAVKETSQ